MYKSKYSRRFFHLDQVPRTFFTANPLRLAGWFLDPRLKDAHAIRVRIGRRAVICPKIPRPDLRNRFSEINGTLAAGFDCHIRTGTGLKQIVIEAENQSGELIELFRKLVWMLPYKPAVAAQDYTAWLELNEGINPPPPVPKRGPRISVLMPVYNPPLKWLKRAIQSVTEQTYPHWELCVANDASTDSAIASLLDACAAGDARIKVIHREVNGHISAASNSALSLCTGDYVALLDHDDELAPDALATVAQAIAAHPAARLFYSDEDKIDEMGRRSDPYFKPDWMPDLLLGQNYLCHLTVYQTKLILDLKGFRTSYEGSQDWDLALRASHLLSGSEIVHIPRILYHWRKHPSSTASSFSAKDYAGDAGLRAVRDHLGRKGRSAEVLPLSHGYLRVRHILPSPPPLVSLIIPTRNRVDILRPCIESILQQTTYPHFELILVDNHSDDPATLAYLKEIHSERVRVLRDEGPFNYSGLNNRALPQARGEIVGFLNNDLEVITSDWLEEMVSQALQPGVGAVGAKLYYPNGNIQHAGVILGLTGGGPKKGVAGHAFRSFARNEAGRFNQLTLVQNYSAVTAACLIMRKTIFVEVGGFNEKDLPIAFNDVDLCLRVLRAGYRNLWTPFAELYHHESASRGSDADPKKRARVESEISYMRKSWGPLLDRDPAYNPNLTLVHEDFSMAWPPRPHSD